MRLDLSRYLARLRRSFAVRGPFCIVLWVSAASLAWGAPGAKVAQTPEIISLYPVGLEKGARATIELRGKHLEGAYAVWFDSRGIAARVEKIGADPEAALVPHTKTGKDEAEDKSPRQVAYLQATLSPRVSTGKHSLRLVGPGGVSKPLAFLVHADRVVAERGGDHSSVQDAQPVRIPLLLEGRLGKMGEVDYYSFEAAAGQELVFHGVSNTPTKAGSFDALQFTLYTTGSSWFDPHRPTRLAFSEDPQLKYRFPKAGRYLLAVGGYMGIGGPDFSYQVRVDSNDERHPVRLEDSIIDEIQHTFSRQLGPDRIEKLWARTVFPQAPQQPENQAVNAATTGSAPGAPGQAAGTESAPAQEAKLVCTPSQEREPNDTADAAQELALPAMVDGTIGRPGDVDSFKFKAKAGQQMAVEVETPDRSLPEFNPRITMSDSKGQEVFSNIWRRVGGDNNQWMKTLQPKTIYTVEKDGEYVLQIRDLVSYLYGDKTFRYRIVIRPQVPHVGKIEVKQAEINLAAGQAEKLNLTVDQEEGYTGDVALTVENLPPGVRAVPAAEVEPDPPPKLDEGRKERFVPKKRELAILLVASADAPPTRLPYAAHVKARPVVGKRVGPALSVQDIPVMVIRPLAASASGAQGQKSNRSDR